MGVESIALAGALVKHYLHRQIMFLAFDDRPSDSPFVERVWRSHSERAGTFLSVASSHWEMVVTRLRGKTMLTLRGPETRATAVRPRGREVEYPSFENAETFVRRLDCRHDPRRRLLRPGAPHALAPPPHWRHAGADPPPGSAAVVLVQENAARSPLGSRPSFKGASLADPHHLFNAGLDAKASRAIDIAEGDRINESALKELVRAAAALNKGPATGKKTPTATKKPK